MSWPEPTSTRDLEVALFPDWKSCQLKYNFGFPKNVDSRTEPLRLDLIPRPTQSPLATTKVLWQICPEASDPPVVAVVVISVEMACGRVADMPEKKLKVGTKTF